MSKKIPNHARLVFKGILHHIYQWEQEMFDGSVQTFEAIKKNDSGHRMKKTYRETMPSSFQMMISKIYIPENIKKRQLYILNNNQILVKS